MANKDMQQHFNDSISEHYMVAEHSQSVQAQLREANLTTRKQKGKLVNELGNTQIDLLNTKIAEASETVSALKHALEGVEREYIELRKIHHQLKDHVQAHSQHRVVISWMLDKDLASCLDI